MKILEESNYNDKFLKTLANIMKKNNLTDPSEKLKNNLN